MPRLVPLSEADETWLRQHHHEHTYRHMARRLNCCTDTLKRILVRLGLATFDGEKYVVAETSHRQSWTRPCMDCKDTALRPRGWYFCRACRSKRGYEHDPCA